jgi:uncharacterized membrane protein
MNAFRIWHHLRTGLWPIPVLCVLVGLGVSFATVSLDTDNLVSVDVIGGPEAALAILGAIAASMITLTGIVLTIVLVVVQLAMGQFSPRIVRAILYDRPSQFAIGIFVATFAHAMLAMRKIATTEAGAPVPSLAIIVAFGLVVVSIVVLILYINHIGQTLRAAALIESVGNETRALLDKLYEDHGADPLRDDPNVVCSPHSGVVFRIDHGELVDAAADANCALTMVPMLGDFVPAGSPLFEVQGRAEALDVRRAVKAVSVGPERTLNQDAAYGFRMLVDIAERCLSDAFDPTTAVQAIDRLHDCLRQLVRRPFPSGEYRDCDGTLRLTVSHITWEGYVRLAFDEIRQTGASSAQVVRRLNAALEDLLTVAPPERRAPLERQLDLLRAGVADNGWPDAERADFTSDRQGIGSANELRTISGRW